MELALYRGPATEWRHKLGHWLVCTLTWSEYSHIELVIRGTCYSSSYRDGGVRSKKVDVLTDHWVVIPIDGDEQHALKWYERNKGRPYDWLGMLRVCPFLRWLPRRRECRFCSEAVAAMLGYKDPEKFSPQKVLLRYAAKAF